MEKKKLSLPVQIVIAIVSCACFNVVKKRFKSALSG